MFCRVGLCICWFIRYFTLQSDWAVTGALFHVLPHEHLLHPRKHLLHPTFSLCLYIAKCAEITDITQGKAKQSICFGVREAKLSLMGVEGNVAAALQGYLSWSNAVVLRSIGVSCCFKFLVCLVG